MRSIKNLNTTISLNKNRLNLIIAPRGWGLTTFLINYINKIPNDKTILFGVMNFEKVRDCSGKITHPNCRIQTIHERGLIGCRFDYIICDNFFENEWIKKLSLMEPTLNIGGKIILADSGEFLSQKTIHYFRNYNVIIKTMID